MKSNDHRKRIEENLEMLLKEGKISSSPDEDALDKLIPKYEQRTQAKKDPIQEETEIITQYIEENNKRYLDYINPEKQVNNTEKLIRNDINQKEEL